VLKLDFSAKTFYNSETKKYDFENAKKPLELEELEDAIAKIVTDKANLIKTIEDPFVIGDPVPWHRLNKKLLDKKVMIKYSSRHVLKAAGVVAKFAEPLKKENYPNVKPADLIDKIN
jgi:hypothetical protein